MPDPVITAAAAAVLLILVIVLLVLLLARRGRYDVTSLFESINRRLDQVETLSSRMGTLSEIFLVPRARGGFGELLLEELLRSWLPQAAYSLQYRFGSGVRADAVVRLGGALVAVDAKFPLESLKRELENQERHDGVSAEARKAFLKHIDDISGKYIVPAEGTLAFALMYVPSERIYYDLFVRADSGLMNAALERGVVPVSPGSLFLYLQTVAFGLKGFAFTGERKRLMRLLTQLRQDLGAFARLFSLAGNHMRNMQRVYDEAAIRLQGLDGLVSRIENPDEAADTVPSGS
jgi:DNA recombination protein RmuC